MSESTILNSNSENRKDTTTLDQIRKYVWLRVGWTLNGNRCAKLLRITLIGLPFYGMGWYSMGLRVWVWVWVWVTTLRV